MTHSTESRSGSPASDSSSHTPVIGGANQSSDAQLAALFDEFAALVQQGDETQVDAYLRKHAPFETELRKLRDLGHPICVDDFGTGYSSLSYMKRLPLNVIKIDRSFIHNVPHDQNDLAISQAIISLSHSLGYKVVAEGVETQEQMDYLIDKACNYAQGYFFSKPVAAEVFAGRVDAVNEKLKVTSGWTTRLRAIRL